MKNKREVAAMPAAGLSWKLDCVDMLTFPEHLTCLEPEPWPGCQFWGSGPRQLLLLAEECGCEALGMEGELGLQIHRELAYPEGCEWAVPGTSAGCCCEDGHCGQTMVTK